MNFVTEVFKKTIINVHGEKGFKWLNELSEILEKCQIKWQLTLITPFINLSYNFVAMVETRSLKEKYKTNKFVLKIGVICKEFLLK